MILEELEDNEDEFNEEDERVIEMYRLVSFRGIVRFFCVVLKYVFFEKLIF